jgi:succinate dehydrogenase/fumarate reductase flavoprotein subunit
LAGSAVQGAQAGQFAAEFATETSLAIITKQTKKEIKAAIFAPLNRKKGYSPAWVTQVLQGIMIPNFILYVKERKLMEAALTYVEYLKSHHVPLLKAEDQHELRLAHETCNMILNAEMKLRTSLLRQESRGSHYRTDYSQKDDQNWLCWITIEQGDNKAMLLKKHAINNPYYKRS